MDLIVAVKDVVICKKNRMYTCFLEGTIKSEKRCTYSYCTLDVEHIYICEGKATPLAEVGLILSSY